MAEGDDTMIIRREALTAALAATTDDDTRYYLSGVQVVPGATPRAVATNGHVLLVVDDEHPHKDEDYPIIVGAPWHGDPPAPLVIPSDIVRAMIATTPKKTTIPILRAIQVSRNGSEQSVTVAATDLQAPRVATLDTTADDRKFPSYHRVLPAADRPSVSVCLAVDVLETLIKAAKAISQTGKNVHTPTIRFSLPTGKQHRDVVTIPGTPAVDATETTPAIAAVEPREAVGDVTGCVGIMITNPGDGFSIIGAAMPSRP
jgi:hypothetical protein